MTFHDFLNSSPFSRLSSSSSSAFSILLSGGGWHHSHLALLLPSSDLRQTAQLSAAPERETTHPRPLSPLVSSHSCANTKIYADLPFPSYPTFPPFKSTEGKSLLEWVMGYFPIHPFAISLPTPHPPQHPTNPPIVSLFYLLLHGEEPIKQHSKCGRGGKGVMCQKARESIIES